MINVIIADHQAIFRAGIAKVLAVEEDIRIVGQPQAPEQLLNALDKLQRFFGEVIRWKSARQTLLVAMLPVWYAPDNIAFRHKVDRAVANRLAPLLTAVIQQGVDEHRFATSYPEQAGTIIVALVQALQDAIAHQLLAAARGAPDATTVKEMVATHGAHIEAIERYLGVPAGALHRADARTVNSWIRALRRADTGKPGEKP